MSSEVWMGWSVISGGLHCAVKSRDVGFIAYLESEIGLSGI